MSSRKKKKLMAAAMALASAVSANRLTTNALTKETMVDNQNSNIIVDDALIKKLQYHPKIMKRTNLTAAVCSLIGLAGGAVVTALIMNDVYKEYKVKVQLVDKNLLMKYIDYVLIPAGFNHKLTITNDLGDAFQFFNNNNEKLFDKFDENNNPYNKLTQEGKAFWDKFCNIATKNGVTLKQLLKKIELDFYSIYFDIIDDIREIAKNYQLSDNVKEYIENNIHCLAFSIVKDGSNKLKLNIACRTSVYMLDDITNKFQENESDRKFFIEIEDLLFNNEYVKHIFQLK